MASKVVRSAENVFSAPIDLRIAIGADGTVVDPARNPVVVGARFAEIGVQELQRLIANVYSGEEAQAVHLRARGWTDAVEFADRQRFDEARSHLRRDDVLSVRLAMIGGQLSQEFVVADPPRSVQAGLGLDLLAVRCPPIQENGKKLAAARASSTSGLWYQ